MEGNKYIYLTILLIIIVSYCCNGKSNNNSCFENDGIRTCLEYNHQGLLIDSANYFNGKLNGVRKLFDSSDNSIYYLTYKNDSLNGQASCYYGIDMRRKIYEGYYKNDKKSGEWYQWKDNEKMERFDYYDNYGNRLFLINYTNSEIPKVLGNPIIHVHFFIDKDSLETYAYVLNPNKISSNRIFIGEIDKFGEPQNVLVDELNNKKSIYYDKRLYKENNDIRIFYEMNINGSNTSFDFKKDFNKKKIDSLHKVYESKANEFRK